MLALRYAALLAIVLWVGGLVAIGTIAAPTIFEVLAARRVPDGRVQAGAIVGEILRRFHHVSYLAGAVLLLSLMTRAALGPRPHRVALRAGLALLMLVAVAYSGFVLSPRIDRLQTSIGAAPSTLPAGDPRRVEFGRLHMQSMGVHMVPLLGGVLLLFFEMKD
jgi:hypothetical protein